MANQFSENTARRASGAGSKHFRRLEYGCRRSSALERD
jgi:hypothetical protein